PLSSYLGKPGNPDNGGLPFSEYRRRQAQHRHAEIAALLDVPEFIEKARNIYGYRDFVCDSGGSLCEVVSLADVGDPVLKTLAEHTLLLYIRGTPELATTLVERFRENPKPMYYQPAFLEKKWSEYKALNGIASDDDVDPDGFAVWGFEELVRHRIPLYESIARKHGYAVEMDEIPDVTDEEGFLALVSRAIDRA
ncbi:MAG TPA: ATPase, partial [Aestuariivirgaceae bacterium]|nr:ATPase [Aestuariivirgaceae bacterium]